MPGVLKTVNLDGYGAGHFLHGQFDPQRSSEQVLLKASAGALLTGAVVAKVTATGQYAVYNPAAADGTQLPANAAILYEGRDNVAATQKAVIVARHQVVNGNALVYPTLSAPEKTALLAGLAANGIIARF